MNLWALISRCRNNDTSLKVRLGLGIGLLLLLNLVIAATILVGRYMLDQAEEVLIDSIEIQRLVLEMDRKMEQARRLHANFFLHSAEIGFVAAHEQYAQPSVRQIAQVITLSSTLKELLGRSAVGEGLRDRHVDVNLYLSFANRFANTSIDAVELFTGLHAPDSGLDPQLDQVLAEIAREVNSEGESGRLFMEMQSSIQQYRIVRRRPLMQSAFNVAFQLRKSIQKDPLVDAERRQSIEDLLDQAIAVAEKILAAETAIKSRFNDFVLQAEAVDHVSMTLGARAGEEVRWSQQRMRDIRRTVISIVVSIGLAGLLFAFFIARMLNRFVIQRVTRLTRLAGELRERNLEVVVPEDSSDELGQLAQTFNLMTARMRELVNNLELKVEQRTVELSVSEKRFRELFENSSSGVVIYEPCDQGTDFIITDCNKSVETIEKMTRGELIGRRVTEVFPGIREFGLLGVLCTVAKTGQAMRMPVSFYSDGRISGWYENAVYKLPSGEVVCVYSDCTAQKKAEAEKQALEKKWQRVQKMEAIGLMAGGVAHDLNNILSGVVGFPDILLRELPEDSKYRKPVQIIKESGQRAAAVVSDLLTVARGIACSKESVCLNTLIEQYLDSPEYQKLASLHPQITCTTQFEPNLQPTFCSPIHVRKCVMNLVSNGMESIEGQGCIVLSTRSAMVDEETARQNNISPGEYVVLGVSDTGKGISDKDMEHIFEPFYSKKVMGISGTGLGLTIVWNTVVDHAGMIQVSSNVGGTSFSLFFPASSRISVDNEAIADSAVQPSQGEKILVVDDEAMLRDLAVAILTRLGYVVDSVPSGEKAMEYLKNHRVDLVLLDMVMEPGINGLETYKQIISLYPGQKAVIVSGFSESEDMRVAQTLGVKGVLKKPYTFELLSQVVRQELDR